MSKADLKVELIQRYCPVCRCDTQHAILYQLFYGRRGKEERRGKEGRQVPCRESGGRGARMRGELQAVETPTLVVLPPPSRGGRYRFEWRPAGEPLACGHC